MRTHVNTVQNMEIVTDDVARGFKQIGDRYWICVWLVLKKRAKKSCSVPVFEDIFKRTLYFFF